MQYSKELNEIQDATINGISVIRDGINDVLETHFEQHFEFKQTISRLVHYQSERSQTVSYLVSSDRVWDAEMILRSFYEANVKIWYLCSLRGSARDDAVEEFRGAYYDVHAHKRRVKAGFSKTVSQNLEQNFDSKIFSALEDEKIFHFHDGNKKERREIEQRWSFSSLIRRLELTPKDILDFTSIRALEHQFGLQSHLLHADISALDMMFDRKTREPDELEHLIGTHICRIFSDQISIWAMTSIAICSSAEATNPKADEMTRSIVNVQTLIKPFSDRFEVSQKDFYKDVK